MLSSSTGSHFISSNNPNSNVSKSISRFLGFSGMLGVGRINLVIQSSLYYNSVSKEILVMRLSISFGALSTKNINLIP